MHADGVGDGLEIERTQMLNAVGKERVLLAHDFGRDLEDGLGALIEARTSQLAFCRHSAR